MKSRKLFRCVNLIALTYVFGEERFTSNISFRSSDLFVGAGGFFCGRTDVNSFSHEPGHMYPMHAVAGTSLKISVKNIANNRQLVHTSCQDACYVSRDGR